jgi:hypothetical protein
MKANPRKADYLDPQFARIQAAIADALDRDAKRTTEYSPIAGREVQTITRAEWLAGANGRISEQK